MWQRLPGVGEAFGLGVGDAPPAPIGQFSTDLVPERDRLDYYHTMLRSLVCAATPVLEPEARAFRVRTENGRLGEALFVHYSATAHAIERSRADTSAAQTGCYFLLRQTGPSPTGVELRGEHLLRPGDCLLGDADSPLLARTAGAFGFSLYLLPKWMVDATLSPAARERLLRGLAAPVGTPMGALIGGWLDGLAAAEGLSQPAAAGVGAILGRLAAVAAEDGAASAEPDRDALRFARAQLILGEIDRGFAEPLFGLADVAAALGLSVRSVHLGLEPTGATFSEHLTHRRLAEARMLLAAGRGRTILDIALSCGFNDLSTFYRSFRRAFGAAPRDLA